MITNSIQAPIDNGTNEPEQDSSKSVYDTMMESYTSIGSCKNALNSQIEELSELTADPIDHMRPGNSDEYDSDPLQICFQNVSEMVKKIKDELELIQEIIKSHEEKYLYYWRTPDYDKNLKHIIDYKKTLDQRVEILIKILSLENY
jgi:hypothetical protein